MLAAAIVAPGTGDERQRVLWMQNARITGSLDLSGVTVPYPIRLDNCELDSTLRLDQATCRRA